MKVIEKLINEISEKTKREIRSITTELKTLSDIIEAEHMLECLKPQTKADENEDMDTEDVISVKEDNICARCRKELLDEKDVAEEIKLALQAAHTKEESENITENMKTLAKRR